MTATPVMAFSRERQRIINWLPSGRPYSAEAWRQRVGEAIEAAEAICQARLDGCAFYASDVVDRSGREWRKSELLTLPMYELAAVCGPCCNVLHERRRLRRRR